MRFIARLLACAVLLVAGCGGKSLDLPDDYKPLERIKESALRSENFVTTIGDTVYVHDLKDWLAKHPLDSPRYKAALLHEQEHAKRQAAAGLTSWIASYMTDTDFMWAEEARGWFYEIKTLQQWGIDVSPEAVAGILKDYKNLRGRMISYNDALVWVRAVIAGQWQPSE